MFYTDFLSYKSKDYEKVKLKIEENIKNMDIMELNKLTTRFKKLEIERENRKNIKGLPNYFDEIDFLL